MRARAVWMILEHEHEYANQSAAIMAIAPKIGCGRDTLRRWVKQSDIDSGRKERQTSDGLVAIYFRSLSSNICDEEDRELQRGTQTRFGVMRFAWQRSVV